MRDAFAGMGFSFAGTLVILYGLKWLILGLQCIGVAKSTGWRPRGASVKDKLVPTAQHKLL
jgi:hypothetical protein